MKRRQIVLGGLAITAGSTLGIPVWSRSEADTLKTEYVRLTVKGLDRPLRVAQLTDIHWDHGNTVHWPMIEEAITQINKEQVDLVALTGDFVTTSADPIHELAPVLGKIQSKEGIFAVLGNHDNVLVDSNRIISRVLTQANITVLENRWTTVAGLAIAGTGDLWRGPYEPERIFTSIRGRKPTLLLAHNPDGFWPLKEERIDIQLSGHTHGGQVRLGPWAVLGLSEPFWPILSEVVGERRLNKVVPKTLTRTNSWAGRFRQGDNQLYVSRGLGRFRRLSIGCPPEVTFFELEPG
jgi:predicted MPP superfamily phosphohydrolase